MTTDLFLLLGPVTGSKFESFLVVHGWIGLLNLGDFKLHESIIWRRGSLDLGFGGGGFLGRHFVEVWIE